MLFSFLTPLLGKSGPHLTTSHIQLNMHLDQKDQDFNMNKILYSQVNSKNTLETVQIYYKIRYHTGSLEELVGH